jgi:hypothetical protein
MNDMNERSTEREQRRAFRVQPQPPEYIVVGTPIPQKRALTTRGPLGLALGGGAAVLAIWVLGILGSAGAITGSAVPLLAVPGSGAAVQQPQSAPAAPVADEPAVTEAKSQPAQVAAQLPPLLQSRSADNLPALVARADGRMAVSGSPATIVVYVPANYYPQPASLPPPTRESAQQTAAIVEQIATGHEDKAVEPARALQAAQPAYAAGVANELQQVTAPSPRYNAIRQVLVELDPAFATRVQVQPQPQVQAQTQTQTQVQTQVQPQAQTQTETSISAPPKTNQDSTAQTSTNISEQEKARRVNNLVMATVPAYLKLPFGMNEGTLQVNTLVAPTPAFLFDQAQIKAALCQIGSGSVVAVNDAVPNAWELKATFVPKDPVRWFTVQNAAGTRFYLPNYVDPVREVQVGDRLIDSGGCNVTLGK